MDWKFKPEDFPHSLDRAQGCVDAANAKIQQWLENASTVYNYSPKLIGWYEHEIKTGLGEPQKLLPTHQAKLICVEQIKK